jgi:hypothetical protein
MTRGRYLSRDRAGAGGRHLLRHELRGRRPHAVVRGRLRGRGRWTQAIAGEIYRYSNVLEFRALKALITGAWLGEAIELDTDDDIEAVERIRAALGGVSAEPLRHLGEAECIRAIESGPELRGAIFLTDDGDAQYLAGHRGITVKNTKWLLADAYAMGDMQCPEPYEVLAEMRKAGRNVDQLANHKGIC